MLSAWIAADPRSLDLLEKARKAAVNGSAVLIRGESGTGKDLLASVIHYLGPNAPEPLLRLDCGGLPPELVEDELFGHEEKRGWLELAARGTVVLDEVGALSMSAQAKLLRAIEERRSQRAGANHPIPALEARIVALTNIDLERALARHTFREDLYYRLNVASLAVPSLRERPADVRPLAEHFLAQLCEVHRKPQMTISAPALAALETYSFPGNVRELRNVLQRAVISSSAPELLLEDLPAHMRDTAGASVKNMSLEEMERVHIAEVLGYTHGKKTRAAQILGISRKTLLEKRKRYGLD